MADDGWEDVTDPSELKKVFGIAGGAPKLSGAQEQELKDARKANQEGRPVFSALAQTYRLAKRYPGGIPQTKLDEARLATGSEATPAQDFDLFNAMNIRAATAKAKLLGANPTDKDLALTLRSVASPRYRVENNKQLIGMDYEAAAQKYFENAFKQGWISRFGSLNGKDARGQSYSQSLAEAFRRPEAATATTAPWNRKAVGGPVAAPRAAAPVDISGFKVKR